MDAYDVVKLGIRRLSLLISSPYFLQSVNDNPNLQSVNCYAINWLQLSIVSLYF